MIYKTGVICQSSAGRHDAGDVRLVHSLVYPRVVKLILVLFVWKPYYQISFLENIVKYFSKVWSVGHFPSALLVLHEYN